MDFEPFQAWNQVLELNLAMVLALKEGLSPSRGEQIMSVAVLGKSLVPGLFQCRSGQALSGPWQAWLFGPVLGRQAVALEVVCVAFFGLVEPL